MIALFASTFALVFLRGYQQQNVIAGHYYQAAVTSYTMAAAEFFLYGYAVTAFAEQNYAAIAVIGTAGAMGITLSMKVKRWKPNTKDKT